MGMSSPLTRFIYLFILLTISASTKAQPAYTDSVIRIMDKNTPNKDTKRVQLAKHFTYFPSHPIKFTIVRAFPPLESLNKYFLKIVSIRQIPSIWPMPKSFRFLALDILWKKVLSLSPSFNQTSFVSPLYQIYFMQTHLSNSTFDSSLATTSSWDNSPTLSLISQKLTCERAKLFLNTLLLRTSSFHLSKLDFIIFNFSITVKQWEPRTLIAS